MSPRLRRVLWIAHIRAAARRIIRDHNTLYPHDRHPFTGRW